MYAFQGAKQTLTKDEVKRILVDGGVRQDQVNAAIELLLWFGFLGVWASSFAEGRYSYSAQYNLRRLLYPVTKGQGCFVVHPAFRAALED